MELKHYVVILRRWGWVMLLCTVLASVASYWFSSLQPPVYEAMSRYLVGPAIDNPAVTSNDLRASSQVGQTYTELVTTRPLVEGVIRKLNLRNEDNTAVDADSITQNVNAVWIDGPQTINIRVRAGDPNLAANIANALGEALIERSPNGPLSLQVSRRQEALSQIAKLQEDIRALQTEIDQLANQVQQTTDPISQRALIVRLDQRRTQLAAAQQSLTDQYAIVQTSSTNQISLMEPAVPNPQAVAPNIQQNVLIALIAGLVLGLTTMFLFEYFVDAIYTPEDLRSATKQPYLGGIARHKRLRGAGTAQLVVLARPDTLAAESYRILRTNVQMASADLSRPSILITSPSRGAGKSEVAANLAVALAQAGKKVILIDANLRQSRIATLFGLQEQQGLSSLLETPHQLLEPMPIESVPGLSVLPAGSPALNSSEILASQHMQQLLRQLKARADMIILDSPPLLYSDALALAPQVDSVLVVTNSGTTSRENITKAVENLRLVNARVIGVVLNRVKPGPAYFYYPRQAARRPISESVGMGNITQLKNVHDSWQGVELNREPLIEAAGDQDQSAKFQRSDADLNEQVVPEPIQSAAPDESNSQVASTPEGAVSAIVDDDTSNDFADQSEAGIADPLQSPRYVNGHTSSFPAGGKSK